MQMSSVGLSKEGVALAPMCYTSYRCYLSADADGEHSWCEKDVRWTKNTQKQTKNNNNNKNN